MIKKVNILIACYIFFFINSIGQPVLPLEDAISQALQNNYDIQISKNDAEIAAISNSWALAGRLPTVNANLGYTYSVTNLQQELSNGTSTKRDGTTNRNLTSSVIGNWRIFNGYRVIAAKNRLEEQQRIGELNLQQQSNQSVYNVITSYYNIARLQQQLTALRETITLFEERMKLSKARFDIGTAAKSDYLQSQVDLNEQRNIMLGIENDIQIAKTSFNNLLSRNPEIAFAVNDTVENVVLPARMSVLQSIDTLNPGLLASKHNEIVLMHQHKEIKSQLYPAIGLNVGASYNRANNNAGFTLLNQTLGPQAGVTVAVPLFQGGNIKKQLQINDIQLKTQKIQTENVRNDLYTTLTNAYNEYDNAKRQYELQHQSLELIKENNNIAMERFRKATITLVDLRQAQISLVTTQTNIINYKYTMKLSEVTLQFLAASLVY